MNQINDVNIDFALLSWTRIGYDLTKNIDNHEELSKNLEKLEEYLYIYGIEKLKIIHQSPISYTIEFIKDGTVEIKEFTVEEVEKFY